MIYCIPGTHKCGITGKLIVFVDGKAINTNPIDPVTISLCGKSVTKRPQWFYGISQVGYVDEFDIEHLKFVYNPKSRSNFPWYAWYDVPKIVFDKYRVVPGYPNVAVSDDGVPIDSSTGVEMKRTVSHGYYHIYCFIPRYNKKLFVPVYKLVALAWLKNDESITRYVVNHLDGNHYPRVDNVENLEWTTYKGNSTHAVETGLVPSTCMCRIRDVKTGEVKSFPSIGEMSDFLGLKCDKETMYFLKRRGNKLFNDKWEVRTHGDDRPWIYAQNCMNIEPSRYIIKVKEPTGEKVFNGVRTLIKHYKLWDIPSWSCAEAVDELKHDHPEYGVEVIDQYDLRPIEVRDITTGKVTTYGSNKELHAKTGWCKSTVIDAVRYSGRRIIYDKYVLRRKSDDPWPTDIRVSKNKPQNLRLTDKDTHEVFECRSLREAAVVTGRDRDYIKRCIESPKCTDRFIISTTPASSGDR